MSLVLDASVALAWCLRDEASGHADFALTLVGSRPTFVPSHWELEVVNGLITAERRERIAPGDTVRISRWLAALPIHVEAPPRGDALLMTHRLAHQHRLSAYDASYVELALRKGYQLITMDPAVAAAARHEGVGG